jgi:hypothetical protein
VVDPVEVHPVEAEVVPVVVDGDVVVVPVEVPPLRFPRAFDQGGGLLDATWAAAKPPATRAASVHAKSRRRSCPARS